MSDSGENEVLSFETAWVASKVSKFMKSFVKKNGLGGGERSQKLYCDLNGQGFGVERS